MPTKKLILFIALSVTATASIAAENSPHSHPLLTQDPALIHAHELLQQFPLADGHNDLPSVIREDPVAPRDVAAYDLRKTSTGDTDIARLRQGHVGIQFWSVYIPGTEEVKQAGFARVQLEQIDIARRVIEQYPDVLRFTPSVAEIKEANEEGYIASLLGIEGGHAIENSLGALRAYYRLGVRYMTLTHFPNNDWADAAGNDIHHGLTSFGKEVVTEMNRLGMLIDLSHVSVQTMHDALAVTRAPVIFSHSNANAITPHIRNVPDEVLSLLPQNGGIVMASFISVFTVQNYSGWEQGFLEASGGITIADKAYDEAKAEYSKSFPEPLASIADVADHLDHIKKVAGVDHVAIGSDFFGVESYMATGLGDVSRFPLLFAELIRRDWSDEDLIKLSRGNVLRVLRQAEEVAAKLQKERPASFATIEELDQGQDGPDTY